MEKFCDKWIAVDWGTSSFRAYLIQNNEVSDTVETKDGMKFVNNHLFEQTLLSLIEHWLGDNDRNAIIQYFNLERHGLRLDLGLNPKDQKRFNRTEWAGFLNKCKGTLSTEAGSFFLDPNDQIVDEVFR